MTDNYVTKRLSRIGEIRKEGDRPLSTDLYFITNRMWYRLGKAFGNSETPKVFDVINKAKIILSSQVNNSVSEKYEELVKKMQNKEISNEMATEVLYQLRNEVKNPEEIIGEKEVDEILAAINETDIDRYAEREAFRRKQEEATQAENVRLKHDKAQIENRALRMTKENETVRKKNAEIIAENKRIEKVNLDLETAIDDKDKTEKALLEKLKKAEQRANKAEKTVKTMAFADFCRKKKKSARWNLALLIIFLLFSTAYCWFADKYHWEFLPRKAQIIVTYLVPQLIPIIRSKVAKIGFWESFKIVFGGGKQKLTKDFSDYLKEEADN